jgi:hypothetical protein
VACLPNVDNADINSLLGFLDFLEVSPILYKFDLDYMEHCMKGEEDAVETEGKKIDPIIATHGIKGEFS